MYDLYSEWMYIHPFLLLKIRPQYDMVNISKNKSFLTKKGGNHEQKRDNSTTF